MSILKSRKLFTINLAILLSMTNLAYAKSFRVSQLPNGSINGCANCHVSPSGGGARTAFGNQVLSSFLSGGNVVWGPALAAEDADGDGFSNGHELEDPFGLWSSGTANPGTAGFVTNPGLVSSIPSGEAELLSLHATFAEMGAHLGNYFELKVVDADNNELIHQETVNSLANADFDFVIMHKLESGGNYNLDFWADLNRNGSYDAPPTDHAWRVPLTGVINNVTSSFTHNTTFTDIGGLVSREDIAELPAQVRLHDNYPNPFNPVTTIRYELIEEGLVTLDIYNTRGELVANLESGNKPAGQHQVTWDARSFSGEPLAAGVYIYSLRANGAVSSKRMMLLK